MTDVKPLSAAMARLIRLHISGWGWNRLEPKALDAIAEDRHRVYDTTSHVALRREDVEWLVEWPTHDAECASWLRNGGTTCTCGLSERLARIREEVK